MLLSLPHKTIITIVAYLLFLTFVNLSFAETLTYKYDDLNRLEQVEYGDGTVIKYTYDEVGNRVGHMRFKRNSTTVPAGQLLINDGAGYTNVSAVKLSLLCVAESGDCVHMQLSNDQEHWSPVEAYAFEKDWSLPGGDGMRSVYVKFTDADGKASEVIKTTIRLDQTAPVTTAAREGLSNNEFMIHLTCNDGNGTGCDKIYYTADGTTPTMASPIYVESPHFSANTTLKYFATDNAGNAEVVNLQNYELVRRKITKKPPSRRSANKF